MTHLKEIQHYVIIEGTLYYRSSDGVLARCLNQEEAVNRMEEIHNITLQRAGYYWLEMEEDAAKLQRDCPHCQLMFNSTEAILMTEVDDWRRTYKEYLRGKVAPCDKKQKEKLL
ncbi:hypothetical protein G4B88_015112 [Cannabis sativa]|uniref:Uncharacterized protein n=1 Tax=Cannabis sativa TaxID=3483 RepID=A0A7J6F0F7_CANSA|nr:hypothetical protein G4B88_015112 [Cannabis sativa]